MTLPSTMEMPGEFHAIISMLQSQLKNLQERIGAQTPPTVTEASMTPDPDTIQVHAPLDKIELNMQKWMQDMTRMMNMIQVTNSSQQMAPPTVHNQSK
jgi:hypothetical protein